MIIDKDYGCDLFKHLLEENKGSFEYEINEEYKDILNMIIDNKIDFNIDKEHLFEGLGYFGCSHLLKQLYKQIYDEIFKKEQENMEKTFNDFQSCMESEMFEYGQFSDKFLEENLSCNADWRYVSGNSFISEKFVRKHINKMNYFQLTKNLNLSETFWMEHVKNIPNSYCWEYLITNKNLSESFIEGFIKNDETWRMICKYCNNINFIIKNLDKVDWSGLSANINFNEIFFEKHFDKIHWYSISSNNSVSLKFLIKHRNLTNWSEVFCHRKDLTDENCREFVNYILPANYNDFWINISIHSENIPESFLNTYKHLLYWQQLTDNDNLSEEFLLQNVEQFINTPEEEDCWYNIASNKNLTDKFVEIYEDKLPFEPLMYNKNISKKFFIKNYDKLMNDKFVNELNGELYIAFEECSIEYKKYKEEDIFHPKNRFHVTFIMKHKDSYSFDKTWKKATGLL